MPECAYHTQDGPILGLIGINAVVNKGVITKKLDHRVRRRRETCKDHRPYYLMKPRLIVADSEYQTKKEGEETYPRDETHLIMKEAEDGRRGVKAEGGRDRYAGKVERHD